MAYCPECQGEIAANAVVCEHCGYDFPPDLPAPKTGFAYSRLADIALIISMIAALLGCGVAILAVIGGIATGDWFMAFVTAPIAFFIQLGVLVVFLRVQDR